jgi:hypothetical protein
MKITKTEWVLKTTKKKDEVDGFVGEPRFVKGEDYTTNIHEAQRFKTRAIARQEAIAGGYETPVKIITTITTVGSL